MNNNNIEAALGDLLALSALKEDDQELSSAPPPSLNLAPPIKSSETGPSPPPPSSSSHYFIATSSTSSSPTPPLTPSLQSPWNHRPPSVPSTSMLTTPTTNTGGGSNVLSGIDLVNLQQALGQQLNQYMLLRQRLMIQISQLKTVPQGGTPQHQFLTANLNQINAQIKGAHHQLSLINQMIHKQQQQQQSSSANLSPDDKDEKDSLVVGGVSSEATPTTSGVDVSVSMQNMSLDPPGEVGKLSARNLSRLQKVMTSVDEGGNSVVPPVTITGTDDTSTLSQTKSALQEETNESPPLLLATSTSITSTVSSGGFTSSGRFSSVRSVDEIPEFKPGVPWNPHSSKPQHSLTAPSTPSGASGDYTVPGMYGNDSSIDKSYSAYNRGGSSYTSSAGFGTPHPSTGGIVGMDSKFQGSLSSRFSNQAPTSLQFNRSNSYNGTSNSFYAGTTMGGGAGSSSAYKGYGVGMQQGQQQKYHPQPSQIHVQQTSSFSRRPKLGHQHSYSGYSSNMPPTPTGGNYGGRSSVSGSSYRGSGGSYGQQQQNKWTFDGNPWGMPATSGKS